MTEQKRRKPRAFRIDDPAVKARTQDWAEEEPARRGGSAETDAYPDADADDEAGYRLPTRAEVAGGIRWGSLFFTAMFALAALAFGIWFSRFISVALAAEGVLGWLANSLLVVGLIAGAVLVVREVFGFLALGRLEDIRAEAEDVRLAPTEKTEADLIQRVLKLYRGRRDMAWHLAEFRDHRHDMRAPGDLMAIADRDVLGPLDTEARQIILGSAKRVSIVTAISPLILIDVLFVFFENVRMLRRLAGLYGGRPGFFGALKLGRMVITNLVAAGGVALTDDLFGQFLGQDLLRRVSRRLGEGAFNGALTVRMGVASIGLTRPLPNIETTPVRVRDVLADLFKWQKAKTEAAVDDQAAGGGRPGKSKRATAA
ncbi:MAG: TIGR01620 family protein [Pseudomonadota bacterium]